jgi:hypothetical protein
MGGGPSRILCTGDRSKWDLAVKFGRGPKLLRTVSARPESGEYRSRNFPAEFQASRV